MTQKQLLEDLGLFVSPPKLAYDQNNDEFILICFWLHRNGYVIKEFPNLLSRPISLRAFAYDDIRKYIWQHIDKDSTVRWYQRKALCDKLSITSDKAFQHIPNELEEKVRLISTRNADFDGMELDEKLENLNNLIEHLLKPRSDGKYISLDYGIIFFGYIDEQDVKNFRLETQCFRHASADNIAKRREMSTERKALLVQFGIFICIHIYSLLYNA